MVASQAGRPFFSPDIRKLLQQADGLHQVPLFRAVELPFIFCRHSHCHDEGIGPLTIRLVGPPWVKVIWALSFVSKSLPSRGIGHSGENKNS
jgi:hypothetical protein